MRSPPVRTPGRFSHNESDVKLIADTLHKGTPRLTSLTSIFQPAPMPSVMSLYERRHQVLKDARLEATGGDFGLFRDQR